MGLLYGRAGRLTAKNGGFRPGQAREAETPHEHWFQATFGTALSAAIDELKTVCLSINHLRLC
jgi:hypothetical protein